MSSSTFRQSIHDLLTALPTQRLDALKKLFWSELNYNRANAPLRMDDFPAGLQEKLAVTPLLFATAGDGERFHIIYCHLNTERLVLGVERQIVSQLLMQHPYGLFLFSDKTQVHWHFVNVKYEKEQDVSKRARRIFRRLTIGPEERLRTAAERIALLDTATLSRDLFGVSVLIIQQRHDEAFNVEAVTEKFFEEYQKTFQALKDLLEKQFKDRQWAHEYALQFLNRLMFLYYVQRKRWLGNDPDFLRNLWEAYSDASNELDIFVSDWLNVLFFEAFNNKFQAGRADRAHFPEKIRAALAMAPYLNGGLFAENRLDKEHRAFIDDAQFKTIFYLFEQYNFTISEDTPLDQEVAVDPEMIGKVYESLVNVSEEADERGEAGIFYTPRVEIDLMCRLTLVDYLANHLGTERKNLLYEVIFAFDDDDKTAADAEINNQNLWGELDVLLRNVTVLDPSCGSGSFLVGMLHVLDDLRARTNNHLGKEETAYERKKDIIRSSLYGVDVMRWAVHVTELRLWLQLVIDTNLAPAELKFRPLLPNLSFKIRHGDSLVQEVGGVDLSVRHGSSIPSVLKGKITDLKAEKRKFYNNSTDEPSKYLSDSEVRQAELMLFREILDTRVHSLQNSLKQMDEGLKPVEDMFGLTTVGQKKEDRQVLLEQRQQIALELEAAHHAQIALRQTTDVPFVWDIAFVEIFEDEKSGFDIVVGNPPYVRQEKIRDPMLPVEDANRPDAKRNYKAKLANAVYSHWVQTFGYNQAKDTVKSKLDAKSDLYVYFYFHSLALLNDSGSFCFITSNSWLDVGYGKDLQEFLLTRGKVKWIIDNQSRRSFASADVNTVIALFAKPHDAKNEQRKSLEHFARFVMLTVPFEYTLTPILWQELEDAKIRTTTPEYRVFPSSQRDLLANGIGRENNKFSGDKWGGKYLRAPSVYWSVFERNKSKFTRLSDVVHYSYGIKPGSVNFFYISLENAKEWKIESKYLKPIVTTSQSIKGYWVNPDSYIFYCHASKKELAGTKALEYIISGEQQEINKITSVKSHMPYWYSISGDPIELLLLQFYDKRFWTPIAKDDLYCSNNFYYGKTIDPKQKWKIAAILNSTFHFLQICMVGRANQGQGVLTVYGNDFDQIITVHPDYLPKEIETAFEKLTQREVHSIFDEVKMSDRKELDGMIFDVLKMTFGERDAFYESLSGQVKSRIEKAISLSARKTLVNYDED